ncbi:MAG: sensor domain-containing diguanylate cyclase [Actinobacteria bacterium]|nr:sensor domain-containing diguanylate cyclase [Actinomycetota bacterium]
MRRTKEPKGAKISKNREFLNLPGSKPLFIVNKGDCKIARMFSEVSGLEPCAVIEISPDHHKTKLQSLKSNLGSQNFNSVIDLTGNVEVARMASAITTPGVHIISGLSSKALIDMIGAIERLERAIDKSTKAHNALKKEYETLTKTNVELEGRLAELYFTHEFFKALAGRLNLVQVCELISDGAVGILAAEIACTYLLDHRAGDLELKSTRGRAPSGFRARVLPGETIIGLAANGEEMIRETDPAPEVSFLYDSTWTGSQIAIPLRMQDEILGVLATATTKSRELTPVEQERYENIAVMSAFALQNALFSEELKWLSDTDRLTELFNHGYFQGKLREEVRRAERTNQVVSLIMIDIDYFKDYNDAFGHPKGDLALKRLAQILKKNTRDIDVPARYGGEEFAVILPATDKKNALVVAERIRRTVEQSDFPGNEELPVVNRTISLGVACYPTDAATPEDLVKAADEALYVAKRGGRNRTYVFGTSPSP